jgi:hypothetical protein
MHHLDCVCAWCVTPLLCLRCVDRLIAHLPTELRAHHVSEATAHRIDDNITSAYFVAPHGSYRKLGSKDALFSRFDYRAAEYSLATQLQQATSRREAENQARVSAQPFAYTRCRPQLLSGLAGATPPDEQLLYVDRFEEADELRKREAFLQSRRILHGPFIPSTGSRSIGHDALISLRLPDIVASLMREIDADWGDTEFQIYVDEEELIIVQFLASSIDNPKGLMAYMNMFVKTNSTCTHG